MNYAKQNLTFRKTLVSLAVVAVCAPAFAQDTVAELTRPQSSASIGVVGRDSEQRSNSLLGQYNGTRPDAGYLTLDVDLQTRDDAAGTATYIKGRNLGLENRDISLTYEKQGDWRYSLEYSELVRRDPRTVNTGDTALGSNTPNVVRLATPGSGADLDFKLKRVGFGAAGEVWLTPNLQMELSFKNEDKSGDRTISRGYDCAAYVCAGTQSATAQKWALLLLDETISSSIKQIEAKFNYAFGALNLAGGYYGSFYTNNYGNLRATVPSVLNNPLGAGTGTLFPATAGSVITGGGTSLQDVLQMPMALEPDNQAHQFYMSGNAKLSASTQATFKYAFTHATQNEDFISMGLPNAPAGVRSLNGVVDTTLLQFGLTSKITPKLSVLGNVRYEDKSDRTPEELYNIEGGAVVPATTPATYVNRTWFNYRTNSTKVVGKLEGTYVLPADLRFTGGLDYSTYQRPVPVSITEEELAGLGAVRAKNEENGYRLELRKSMGESLTGSLAYSNSKRRGSDWTSLSTSASFVAAGLGYGQTGNASQFIALSATNAFPMSMADVDRDKIKLSANWNPSEALEVQVYLENGMDKNVTAYSPVAGGKGWRSNASTLFSVDASYALSDNWKVNGYLSQGVQNLLINHSTGYMANLESTSDGFGMGLSGNATSSLEIGALLSYLNDTTHYGLTASPSATGAAASAANLGQAAIGLPDVAYQTTSLSIYGKYALDKKSSIRVSLVSQQAKLDEWSYGYNGRNFLYSDNTTVTMKQNQVTNFLGVAYIAKF